MAVLKDLIVNGPSRLVGDAFTTQLYTTIIQAPTTSNGSVYGPGSNGQILKSNGTSIYWATDLPDTASRAITAAHAVTAGYAITAAHAVTAGYAITAARAATAGYAITAGNAINVLQGAATADLWRKILVSGVTGTSAYNTAVATGLAPTYQIENIAANASTGTIKANNLHAARAYNALLTATSYVAGATATDNVKAASWQYNTGANATNGEVFTIKTPVAGHDAGVYMSVNNGTNFYPIVVSGTAKLTTHFPAGSMISVAFDSSGSAASMYSRTGGNATATTVTGGVFRILNYYDSGNNRDYGVRVYRLTSGYNADYPLLVSRTAAASIGTVGTNSSSTNNVYAVIWNDATKIPTLNPSTGLMKVPGGITSVTFTGGLNGTASRAITAGYATTAARATTAGYAITAGYAVNATDTKVTQAAATTTNAAYPVILANSTATTAVTNTVNKASTLTYNPSTTKLHTPIVEVTSASFGGTLPSTGTTGQVFFLTGAEYYELPTGGTTGLVLAKSSNADRAVLWVSSINISPSSAKFYPAGSTVNTTNSNPQVFNTAIYVENNVLFGAAWNDYAEYRESLDNINVLSGRCVVENGDDTIRVSISRMEPGASIVSDTYGFAIGKTEAANLPVAVSGRVLAYPYEDREEFKKNIGKPVCSGPNGTVSIMTDEEYRNYGYCAIGTISSVPNYETWGENNIKVNNRVWIKVR